MTANERDTILRSEEYIGKVRIAFYDWLEYWAVAGTAGIEDPEIRELTDQFIGIVLNNPEAYVNKLCVLVISEPVVKEAVEVTDQNVSTAVNNLLANALRYLI